jgi:molybdopterin-guanine dinucleotide biosynthesis protein A
VTRLEDRETDGSFTALVLAGRRGGDDPVARYCGVEHKCLAPAGGLPMLVRVVEALAASPSIGRIFVALEDPALLESLPSLRSWRERGRCRGLESAATPSLSVLAALEQISDALPVLVTTGDHPLLSAPIVEQFCQAARASGADLVAGLTAAAVIREAYPQSQRTYLRFRDARYSGANLFAILTPSGPQAVAFWRRVEQERKRPWRIVRAFGLGPLLAYFFGRLTLDAAMALASAVIGVCVAAVRLPFAEAAIDVDKPADLDLVNLILARRG